MENFLEEIWPWRAFSFPLYNLRLHIYHVLKIIFVIHSVVGPNPV